MPPAPPTLQAIHVLIDDAQLQSLPSITRALEARGFVLTQTLDAIGVLAGLAPDSAIEALRNVPGVLGIEKVRRDYELP